MDRNHLTVSLATLPHLLFTLSVTGVTLASSIDPPPWSVPSPAARRPFAAIDTALASGDINPHTAAVYRYFAVFEPARLPARFAKDAQPILRCATAIRLAALAAVDHVPASLGLLPGLAATRFAPCHQAPPFHVDSVTHPLRVHWSHPADAEHAQETLGAAEHSWDLAVNQLGFSPPLSDQAQCGGDDRFDIFLLRGTSSAYTVEIAPNSVTEWDDYSTYVVIDPLIFGGPYLRSTVAHELNHALQAADDWWEILTTLESTATFIEEITYDDDNFYFMTLQDFQAFAGLPFEYNDRYLTWFMYGGVLYWLFVRDHYMKGDSSFISYVWRNMRSPARGTYRKRSLNEPDFADGVEQELLDHTGVTYRDSVLEFNRWRWFVGQYDDGSHFEEGGLWPPDAEIAPLELTLDDLPYHERTQQAPQIGGVAFVRVDTLMATPGHKLWLSLRGEEGARWHVEALTYDDTETASGWRFLFEGTSGQAEIDLTAVTAAVLMIYHVPPSEYDPDYFRIGQYPYLFDVVLVE